MTADTEQLINDARAGVGPACGELLERYRNYLTLLARIEIGRRLQGKFDACDVVQEVFLEAHRHIGVFRGTSEPQFIAWLRQILATRVAHLVRRYLGTQGRNARLEQELEQGLDESSRMLDRALVAEQSSPSQQAVRREQAVLLADALSRLSEDYRDVIVLRHIEGLTFPQVAERMDKSLDSVEKLWLRALTKLRKSFGGGL